MNMTEFADSTGEAGQYCAECTLLMPGELCVYLSPVTAEQIPANLATSNNETLWLWKKEA